MDERSALSRLTEREKVCLRQWLQHKSAKEIAAELGISHHAVEKRLKMARIKLGATSSLEAARMLVGAEGYGQTVPHSADLAPDARPLHAASTRVAIGVAIMIFVGAIMLALLQPAVVSQAGTNASADRPRELAITAGMVPDAGTEAALRTLVAGLASGSPDYSRLSPQFAEIVRRDLPKTHPMFSSMGRLESVTFRGRGSMSDDVYSLVFTKGEVIMSAKLDADGRMAGGILTQAGLGGPAVIGASSPTAGTEATLRRLAAGLASGSPDYSKLSPQFAGIVRRDLPKTHPMFSSMGELKSVTFRGRGATGDDVYDLAFANGAVRMSAKLDANGRMIGGMLQPIQTGR